VYIDAPALVVAATTVFMVWLLADCSHTEFYSKFWYARYVFV